MIVEKIIQLLTSCKNKVRTKEENSMEVTKLLGRLETIGKCFATDGEKGLAWAVKYAIPDAKLVGLFFPEVAPEALGVAEALNLIQNAVLQTEQKYAAAKIQNGTGAQKAEEVLTLVGPAATLLLKQGNVVVDDSRIKDIISAVVSILNVSSLVVAK